MMFDTPEESVDAILKKQRERSENRERNIIATLCTIFIVATLSTGFIIGRASAKKETQQESKESFEAGREYERSVKRKALIEIGDSFDKKWECFIVE